MFTWIKDQATTVVSFEPAEKSHDETPPVDDEDVGENTIGSAGEGGDMCCEVQPLVILSHRDVQHTSEQR